MDAVIHLSGALDLTPLRAAAERGWQTGSLHPLQAFPRPQAPAAFQGITFALEADADELAGRLDALVRSLGAVARPVAGPARARYHAAAVIASNYVVALEAVAAGLLEELGWTRREALDALLPLLRGVADDLAEAGLPAALTGPIARGDAAAVRRHLEALDDSLRARVYRIVGLAALEVAREAGLGVEAAGRIEEALTG